MKGSRLADMVLLLAMSTAVAAGAGDIHQEEPNLVLSIDTKPFVLQRGEMTKLNVKISNIGQEPIEVERVISAGCKCTGQAEVIPACLPAGQNGILRFTPNSLGRDHTVERFFVLTKDKRVLRVDGELQVRLARDILVDPLSVEVGDVAPEKPVHRDVNIVANGDIDVNSITLQVSSPRVEAHLTRGESTPRHSPEDTGPHALLLLRTTLIPPDQAGPTKEYVEVSIKQFKGRDLIFRVQLSCNVVTGVKVDPDRLFLGYVEAPKTVIKTITLSQIEQDQFDVVSVGFPKEVVGSYSSLDLSHYTKEITLQFGFMDVKEKVGCSELTFMVKCRGKTWKVVVPVVYIGKTHEN